MAIEKEINMEGHMKKYNAATEQSAINEAEMIEKVDAYLASQTSGDMTYEQVRAKYIKEYIDFLESSVVQPIRKGQVHKPLSPEQKLAIIKRQIYMYEILPQEKKDLYKAA